MREPSSMIIALIPVFWMACVQASLHIPGTSPVCYTRPGDVIFGLVVGATNAYNATTCSDDVNIYGVQIIETFVYAIDQININPAILPNITIGFVVLDACNIMHMFLAQTLYMIPDDDVQTSWQVAPCTGEYRHHYEIAALLADYRSRNVLPVATAMSMTHTPIISVGATSDELSDQSRFGYLLRLTPTDKYQTDAILQILVTFNWTYFSIIHTEGSYGENGAKNLQKGALRYELCIEHSHMLYAETRRSDLINVLQQLRKGSVATVIVLFMESEAVQLFFELLDQELFERFIWVGSHAVTFRTNELHLRGLLISIDHDFKLDTEVREHYYNLSPATNPNPWFWKLWEELYECSWRLDSAGLTPGETCENTKDPGMCEGPSQACDAFQNRTLPDDVPYGGIFIKFKDAVDTLARGLHGLVNSKCPNGPYDRECINGEDYLKYIQNVSFEGYSWTIEFQNGVIQGRYLIKQFMYGEESKILGRWVMGREILDINVDMVDWAGYKGDSWIDGIPQSVCSLPCALHQYFVQKEVHCCWECHSCRDNEIVVDNGTSCQVCDENQWPDDATSLLCLPIPPVYLRWDDDLGIVMLTLATIGMVLSVVVAVFFIRYRQERLIKASSKNLMAMILCGIVLAFTSVFIVLAKPRRVTCFLRDLGFSVSVTVIYAPILVKAIRVYRIFAAGKKGRNLVFLVSSRSQIFFSLTLVFIQIVLTIVLDIFLPSHPLTRMPVLTEEYTEMLCTLPQQALLVLLTYNLLLLLACAALGFLTRKLPENFNESWFIFVSVSTTAFLWVVLLPTYFTTFYAYHKAVLLATCLILNAYITLICLFLPKIYAVVYVSEQNMHFVTTTNATAPTTAPTAP